MREVEMGPKTVWVATIKVQISRFKGTRTIAIVMNAPTFKEATDMDLPCLIPGEKPKIQNPKSPKDVGKY
jgi:hypothetical protein